MRMTRKGGSGSFFRDRDRGDDGLDDRTKGYGWIGGIEPQMCWGGNRALESIKRLWSFKVSV